MKYRLIKKDESPEYTWDSPYILTGYRPTLDFFGCLQSCFQWHNQTVNIWSSILLASFNCWLAIYFTETAKISNIFYFFFWLQGGLRTYCWLNSFSYHTFVCHGEYTAKLLCNLDYIGCYLTCLGMGSSLIFIELYCFPSARYTILFLGLAGICGAIIISILPKYQSEKFRAIRMILSVFSSMPYLVGLLVAIYLAHENQTPKYYSYLLYGFAIELLGAFFYMSMLPEKAVPIIFDNWLTSHNIWHIMNFGFDGCMMLVSYHAYIELNQTGMCKIYSSNDRNI